MKNVQYIGLLVSGFLMLGLLLIDRLFPGENPIPGIARSTPVLFGLLSVIGPTGMKAIIDKLASINYGDFTMKMKDGGQNPKQ